MTTDQTARIAEILEEILDHAVATCEREGSGIEDTDDMIAIRRLAEAALETLRRERPQRARRQADRVWPPT